MAQSARHLSTRLRKRLTPPGGRPEMGSDLAPACRDLGECARGPACGGRADVHFARIPARCRALPPNPCKGANSCKKTGEVHGCLQGNGGSARRNERLAGLLTCTSPKSLHEIAPLQGNVRSARLPARNWSKCMAGVQPAARKRAKCTAGCRKSREMHDKDAASCREMGEARGRLQEKPGSARRGCNQLQGNGQSARPAAGKGEKCTRALELGPFRTFPHHPCTWKISCKDRGEMYDNLQRNGGNGRKTTCRAGRKRSFPAYLCTSFPTCSKCGELHGKGRAGRACGLPEDAVGEPLRSDDPPSLPNANRADALNLADGPSSGQKPNRFAFLKTALILVSLSSCLLHWS